MTLPSTYQLDADQKSRDYLILLVSGQLRVVSICIDLLWVICLTGLHAAFVQLSAHVVDFGGSSPALKAWQLLTGMEVNSKFRFNASMDAEAFLLWWPGGLPIEWTPSAGMTLFLPLLLLHHY